MVARSSSHGSVGRNGTTDHDSQAGLGSIPSTHELIAANMTPQTTTSRRRCGRQVAEFAIGAHSKQRIGLYAAYNDWQIPNYRVPEFNLINTSQADSSLQFSLSEHIQYLTCH